MQEESLPWWRTDLYSQSRLTPPCDLTAFAGPRGLAYVEVIDEDGRTQSGWGEKTFVENYNKQRFTLPRAEARFFNLNRPFALVMRSVSMVCIDIDGKNGGFDSAPGLVLPPTLAETSKSGNGFHLFYTVDDTWNPAFGFRAQPDRIGFVQGVDLRGTGVVYHHPSQQWNTRTPVPLPDHVADKLKVRLEQRAVTTAAIQEALASDDPTEILMIQEHVKSRLTAPIPDGKRNQTLFALGSEMHVAQVPGWEQQIYDRGIELGLDDAELTKLISNVRRYAN